MRYYLGPWIWDDAIPAYPTWRAPTGCVGTIDLRPLPARRRRGGAPQGVGIFAMPDTDTLDSDYRLFGQGDIRDLVPIESDRGIFASMIGVRSVEGNVLVDWLWTALSTQADPFGETGPKPLIPTSGRHLEMYLAGLVRREPFSLLMPEAAAAIQVLQMDYRAIVVAAGDGKVDAQLPRKVLGAWGQKYDLPNPQDVFIPADLPKLSPLPPTTTIVDNFNRTANLDGSTTSDSLGTWAEYVGTAWATNGSTAGWAGAPGDAQARVDADLSSDDHYAQFAMTFSSTASITAGGPTCRKAGSSTQTFYENDVRYTGSLSHVLRLMEAGVPTTLDTGSASHADGDVLKVEADGSSIKGYINGGVDTEATDSGITGNLRCGIQGYGDNVGSSMAIDNFEMADLGAAVTNRQHAVLRGVRAGVMVGVL